MSQNYVDIAIGIAAPGWIPVPFQMPSDHAAPLKSLVLLAEGAGAAFTADVWIACHTNAAGTGPKGLVKVEPQLVGAATTEFPAEAVETMLFDAPFLWLHVNVKSLTGVLSVRGVF